MRATDLAMRGLYLDGGRLELRTDLQRPHREDEVRVRVLCAGICATDLALRRGYMGFAGTPGHEFVGIAEEGPLAGQRVVGEINAGCGRCGECADGRQRHCPHRTVLGILRRPGAFAEELSLPAGNLHRVPDEVSTDAATFIEPLAAAFEIAEQVELSRDPRCLVVGDGKLGILCAHVLALHGVRVDVAGRHPERLSILPRGARHHDGLDDVPLPGEGFDLLVEATGDERVLPRILPLVRPRGTVVLKTTTENETTLDTSLVVVNELTVVGSRCGPFPPALQALAEGRVPVEALIAGRYPLERGVDAFDHAGRRGSLKILVDVSPS